MAEDEAKSSAGALQEMQRQVEELTKGQNPAIANQMKTMMAGMMGVELPKEPEKAPEIPCQNCAKNCIKPLRCGTCKAVSYCSAQCQKDDWRFHKRICKKPDAPVEKKETPPVSDNSSAPRPKEHETVVEKDDVGTWYKHREWKPQETPQEFTPARAEPVEKERAQAGSSAGSSWNAAGTWEEKNMLPWWQERLQKLQGLDDGEGLQIDKVGPIQGEASIVLVRGKPKFMYDLEFNLSFSGIQRCKPCSRSPPGSRCSNCMRVQGKIIATDFNWTMEGDASFPVRAEEPSGPSHVKKAGPKECPAIAEAKLVPAVRASLDGCVAEYKAMMASDGPQWASQLPPAAA